MPKWGLTEDQRAASPWGIDPKWLEPDKTITDPVHHDIYVTKLETAFIDSPPMQRLRTVVATDPGHAPTTGANAIADAHFRQLTPISPGTITRAG